MPGGWAWIPAAGDRIVITVEGARREVPKPAWSSGLNRLAASPDGRQLAFTGWNVSTQDSLGLSVVATSGGTPTPWVTRFAEGGSVTWLDDRSLLFAVWQTAESVTLLEVAGPGPAKDLGTIPHPVRDLSMSRDLGQATAGWRDYRGDAWLYRVDRP